MDVLESYKLLQTKHQSVFDKLKKQSSQLSILRLILILAILFVAYLLIVKTASSLLGILLVGLFISFFVAVNFQSKIEFELSISKELVQINKDEISLIKGEEVQIENGEQFLAPKHMYSFDIDIFGRKSLYQYLNRTATFVGQKKLASLLNKKSEESIILKNQDAVKELQSKIDWRQNLLAYAKIAKDNESTYQTLITWVNKKTAKIPKWITILSFVFPSLLFISIGLTIITKESIYSSLALNFFVLNLVLVFSQFKKIQAELNYTSRIEEIVKSYSLIIEKIEAEGFYSEQLVHLKSKLDKDNILASSSIQELSNLFAKLSSILNIFGSTLLSGLFMYHVHIHNKLRKWKESNAFHIDEWMNVVGEFEALNSLANFSYNNPNFVFPELNNDKVLNFKNLGHPLLNNNQRVDNDITFSDQRFVILTGSNMSGKSTFLRSLGVNMVLAAAGAPVCASEANIHPMQILVSMRLMDSLDENESYFFAEVKRLKAIMDLLENETSFVILDEILRGTNSDDKRQGTIEVIKQMISKNAIGIIATHDLEVCKTTNEFPEVLSNKCFEVEIVDNDLSFDYKLREGICKNKSASFLMKKMEVI